MLRLDHFEGIAGDDPACTDPAVNAYHRTPVTAVVTRDGATSAQPAFVYIKNAPKWVRPPAESYKNACWVNITQFWPLAELDIRDSTLAVRETWRPASAPVPDAGGHRDGVLLETAPE